MEARVICEDCQKSEAVEKKGGWTEEGGSKTEKLSGGAQTEDKA